MKGDLHCHTKLSDGSEGIEEVIAMAKRIGLDFIAITDHDTISSLSRAKVLAKRYGVQIIPGTEFSCWDYKRNRKVHILCYLPEKPDRLEGQCIKTSEERKKKGKEMLLNVMRYFPITIDDVMTFASSSNAIYKQHIMHALMCHGYTTRIFGDLYSELFEKNSEKFSNNITYPDVYDVIDLIHQAQGLAVLAHPSEFDSIELLEELATKKFLDGAEVYHSRCSIEDEKRLFAIATANNLAVTGGSDFHGFYSSRPCPIGKRFTPQDALDELFKRKELYLEGKALI